MRFSPATRIKKRKVSIVRRDFKVREKFLMAELFVVYPGVELGEGTTVGEFALVGVPLRDAPPGGTETRIGARSVIRSHTVIYAGNRIGANFQTGHGVMI